MRTLVLMGNSWFAERPEKNALTPFQRQALVRFCKLLDHCEPSRTQPELTSASLDDGGFLSLSIRHSHQDFEISLFVNDVQTIVSWGAGSPLERTIADYAGGPEALQSALEFIRHILLGRLQTETTYRDGAPARVDNYLVDERGRRSQVSSTGQPSLNPLTFNPFKKRRVEVQRISFID
nr:MetaGeneMark_Unknown Function [uncultured bacterium]